MLRDQAGMFFERWVCELSSGVYKGDLEVPEL